MTDFTVGLARCDRGVRAQYFPNDRECLLEPEPNVAHYEVLVGPELLITNRASRGAPADCEVDHET